MGNFVKIVSNRRVQMLWESCQPKIKFFGSYAFSLNDEYLLHKMPNTKTTNQTMC